MIINPEKISKCTDSIKNLVRFLESIYGTVTITSGYRSPAENAAAGGASGSAHLKGCAVDIVINNVHPVKVAAKVLDNIRGIQGLGLDIYQGYVHFDFMDRGAKTLTTWVYDRQGKFI